MQHDSTEKLMISSSVERLPFRSENGESKTQNDKKLKRKERKRHDRASSGDDAKFANPGYSARPGAVARSAAQQGHGFHRGRAGHAWLTRFSPRARALDGGAGGARSDQSAQPSQRS